jgi:hypothetical protein
MVINDAITPNAPPLNASNRSKALFLEADRLNDQAYVLLDEPVSPQTIHKFSEAKKQAEDKYRQACQEWLHARDKINR